MNKKEFETAARAAAVRALEKAGYTWVDASSGSGVPKLSRLRLVCPNGEEQSCVVKFTTSGRIHFVRKDDEFKVLRETDLVLHVLASTYESDSVQVSLYRRDTVESAFRAAFDILDKQGQGHIPIWLSPEFEEGVRFTGSGFKRDALWVVNLPISTQGSSGAKPTDLGEAVDAASGIMERAKTMLAEHMGVRPEQLELDVRIKV